MLRALVGRGKRAKRRAKQRLGLFDPLQILPFRSYGSRHRLLVMGRVLEEEGVIYDTDDASKSDDATRSHLGLLGNVRASLRRLRSDEIPDAILEVRFRHIRETVTTDEEGYFKIELLVGDALEPGWHDVELVLLRSMAGCEGIHATARVLVPPDDCALGIISDIDDTVVHTGSYNRLTMVRTVLFENAHTREPLPGVANFYEALQRGPDGSASRPIFYLSRSGWNLYDLFDAFFEMNGIPRGPILLRDLHVIEPPSPTLEGGKDKTLRIAELFAAYPRMKFVLSGDSAQKDPEHYLEVARQHPGRVVAVYIRDVVEDAERDRAVAGIMNELCALGVSALAVKDTDEAARHAKQIGLI